MGPGIVHKRVGEHSYIIQVKRGETTEAHRSQLRRHIPDSYVSNPTPLYYYSGKAPDLSVEPDQWAVEKIMEHRVRPDGVKEFLVKWEGVEDKENTWEPFINLITPNQPLMDYCQIHDIDVSVWEQWVLLRERERVSDKGKSRKD